jgi:uncharacterized membrane protein
MDIHEDPQISRSEKVTRIGCGAVFGIFFGFFLVIKFALSSFGAIAGIVALAICVCAYLALKYGDEFWYSIFGRGR